MWNEPAGKGRLGALAFGLCLALALPDAASAQQGGAAGSSGNTLEGAAGNATRNAAGNAAGGAAGRPGRHGPAADQGAPLSVIDWLSDSLREPPAGSGAGQSDPAPVAAPVPAPDADSEGSSAPAPTAAGSDAGPAPIAMKPGAGAPMPGRISVERIDGPLPDAVGLLPPALTGLPPDFWKHSRSEDIALRFNKLQDDLLPATRGLIYTLALAELEPPADSSPTRQNMFLARTDWLLRQGALEQAQALLRLAGLMDPQRFRRAFDISLLLGREDETCAILRRRARLSPTFQARIFCLARGGDWAAAALSLETGRALGFINDEQDALLERFLDLVHPDPDDRLPVPQHPSPLVFRMHEAIGEALPTIGLPRAFAWADLHANAGWRAQIEAAERLLRSGAIDPNRLLGLYMERRPAASGGVWDRVAAVQALSAALDSRDPERIGAALPVAWKQMASEELEVPFASLFAHRLAGIELQGEAADLAFTIGLLSPEYESFARRAQPRTERQRLLVSIALGNVGADPGAGPDTGRPSADRMVQAAGAPEGSEHGNGVAVPPGARDPFIAAVIRGFQARDVPVRLRSLVSSGRLGEATLRAVDLFENGKVGNLDALSDSLAFLRITGFEGVARRAALQLLLLDRRG